MGQAQLRNVKAVPKQPVLGVAAYSALLLASLIAFGAERGPAYEALPKWRRKAYRPSCLDPITLVRNVAPIRQCFETLDHGDREPQGYRLQRRFEVNEFLALSRWPIHVIRRVRRGPEFPFVVFVPEFRNFLLHISRSSATV